MGGGAGIVVGAVIGAVANKKNPLKGALIGGGLGYLGGQIGASLGGAEGAIGAAEALGGAEAAMGDFAWELGAVGAAEPAVAAGALGGAEAAMGDFAWELGAVGAGEPITNVIDLESILGVPGEAAASQQLFIPEEIFVPKEIVTSSGPDFGGLNFEVPSADVPLAEATTTSPMATDIPPELVNFNWEEGLVNPPPQRSFLQELMQKYDQVKDPLRLIGAIYQLRSNNQLEKMMEAEMRKMAQASFPYQEFVPQARDFFDPEKRYEMLVSQPGYQEAKKFLEQQELRRLAQGGQLRSGYRDIALANVIAQNAQNWNQAMFNQISAASGMPFGPQVNAQATLAANFLPQLARQRRETMWDLADAIRKNQGFLPEIFKTKL